MGGLGGVMGLTFWLTSACLVKDDFHLFPGNCNKNNICLNL